MKEEISKTSSGVSFFFSNFSLCVLEIVLLCGPGCTGILYRQADSPTGSEELVFFFFFLSALELGVTATAPSTPTDC